MVTTLLNSTQCPNPWSVAVSPTTGAVAVTCMQCSNNLCGGSGEILMRSGGSNTFVQLIAPSQCPGPWQAEFVPINTQIQGSSASHDWLIVSCYLYGGILSSFGTYNTTSNSWSWAPHWAASSANCGGSQALAVGPDGTIFAVCDSDIISSKFITIPSPGPAQQTQSSAVVPTVITHSLPPCMALTIVPNVITGVVYVGCTETAVAVYAINGASVTAVLDATVCVVPMAMVVDVNGLLWVACRSQGVLTISGTTVTVVANGVQQCTRPVGLSLGVDGSILVACSDQNVISMVQLPYLRVHRTYPFK